MQWSSTWVIFSKMQVKIRRYHFKPTRAMITLINAKQNKARMWRTWTPVNCLGECEMVQMLWKRNLGASQEIKQEVSDISRLQHRSFCFVRPRKKNKTWTRHHWENPRICRRGLSNTLQPETVTDCARRVREMATWWPHCPSPRPVKHHKLRSLQAYGSSSEEKEPRLGNQPHPSPRCLHCGSFCGSCHYDVTPWRLQSAATGNLTVIDNGEEPPTTSTGILTDWVHTCSVHVIFPTSGFTHLQNQVGGALWSRNSPEWRSVWLASLNEKVCWP